MYQVEMMYVAYSSGSQSGGPRTDTDHQSVEVPQINFKY
jgi:hypothetical protein